MLSGTVLEIDRICFSSFVVMMKDLIERRLAVNAVLEEPLTDDILVTAFQRRLRLMVLLCDAVCYFNLI